MATALDEDPNRLIFDNVRPLSIPIWEPKALNARCHHCDIRFGLTTVSHNCRLCGFLYCGQCTGKYHVPDEYKLKHKVGAVRVCFGCRDKCLPRPDAESEDSVVVIHPPVWVEEDAQSECAKCRRRWTVRDGKHFCRCCGHIYCNRCSSKMSVPPAYCKKEKKGPRRVCDLCRYLIVSGAELSVEPMPAPPPQRRPTEPCNHPAPNSTDDEGLVVRWRHDDSFLVEMRNIGGACTLKEYHQQLMTVRPELEDEELVYYCRDIRVDPVHYDIFEHRHLLPALMVERSGFSNTEEFSVLKPRDVTLHAKRSSNIHMKPKVGGSHHHRRKGDKGVAVFEYSKPGDKTHLSVKEGDIVLVTKRDNDSWWFARTDTAKGWLPASYVRLLHTSGGDDGDDDCDEKK